MSTQWNKQLNRYVFSKVIECLEQNIQNKLIAKDHWIPSKWTEYKIFELKYGNTKLWGNTKYIQVKLVYADFASVFLYQVSIKLYYARSIQLVSMITLDLFDFNKHLTIK